MNIVITGTSRGIGAGLAQHYRTAGHHVIGTARDGSADVQLDVAKTDEFDRLSDAVGQDPVDLLVCNAGVFLDKGARLEDGYDAQVWAQTFAVNVTGVFLTVQALLANLRAAHAAKIAIISSQMASHTHAPGGALVYRASKAAVLNLGRNLASELRGDGIAVGIYHPGWVRTDMGGGAASISVDESVAGLAAEFEALDRSQTGCFRTWDGRDHAY